MKYSYRWIQEHIKEQLPPVEELKEKIIFHAFEVESVEHIGEDALFDIKVLPDRAGDCLSHAGMAREVAGLFGLTFKEKELTPLPIDPSTIAVDIKSDLCRTYLAVRIDNVKVNPSPDWLKAKLEAIGQRSINNIVDATNVVLFDTGQPIHAFDAGKVDGGIVVRSAHEGEAIKLLGGEEKTLNESDLVIADYLGAIAIAGVKGGASAEVTDATTSIIIEVANFDAASVRKTSRRLGLLTDASKRFENKFSPLFALPALQEVVSLILDIAGGVISGINTEHAAAAADRTLSFSLSDITRLLGNSITISHIDDVLARYRYTVSKEEEGEKVHYVLTIPHYRADITGPHDLAEEIGRVTGYEHIPPLPLPLGTVPEENSIDTQIRAARAWAMQNGFREVYTYTFRPKGQVAVAYGAKGKDRLRNALSDGLRESYELNRLNALLIGVKEVKLFEIGTVFFTDKEEVHVAIVDKGTIQELPLSDFLREKGIDVAMFATSFPEVVLVPTTTLFTQWSLYPYITRDIAVWVKSDIEKEKLLSIANAFAASHCTQSPQLFDEFSKDGRTSIALRFIFQAPDRTLTDAEVSMVWNTFLASLKQEDAFEIR